jgi:competence protein ComFC
MAPKPYFPTTRDQPASFLQKILDGLLNVFYPDQCFICSVPIARRQDCGICSACWNKVLNLKIVPPRCSSCGLPFQSFQDTSEFLCGSCILQMPPYSGARSFGYYTAELSNVIQEMKFHGRRDLVGHMAPLLTEIFFENWSREDFDLVVPVPLHPRRKRERGFNQSELLARSLAAQSGVPFCDALMRIRPTIPQIGLSDAHRQENVRKAFRCRDAANMTDQRILLIDDVMTTGATVSSAAQAMLEEGAMRISILTVARAGKW